MVLRRFAVLTVGGATEAENVALFLQTAYLSDRKGAISSIMGCVSPDVGVHET